MAAVKSTYSLDAETLEKLNQLARRWQVSKTEVLRRAISHAAKKEKILSAEEKIEILRGLQRELKEQGVDFEAWKETIALARR